MNKPATTPAQGGNRHNAHRHNIGFTTKRQYRVMRALLQGPQNREAVDRIAGASNGPEVVRQLREMGYVIPCERVAHVDRDKLRSWHGVYSLSQKDRLRFFEWLGCRGGAL